MKSRTSLNHSFIALAVGALLLPTLTLARPPAGKPPEFPAFIPFDASQMELPEGVAVDKVGNVYVSVGTSIVGPMSYRSDQLWKFSPSGVKSVLADFGPPGGGGCGLAVDAVGNVYMARNLMPYNGVFRVDQAGNIVLLPGTEQIVFPDGLAFDQEGNLYITESWSLENPNCGPYGNGGIWRVPRGGSAALWLRHDVLTGACPPLLFPYPIGANGIAFYNGNLYVNNTDKALVVRVPVRPDGSPGEPEVWKQAQDVPESVFYQSPAFALMLDGIAMDVHGNVYLAVPSRAAIVRINAADLSQETVAVYPGSPVLDAPLSLTFGTGMGERECLFVTNSGFLGFLIPGFPWPGPGLVKINVGIPGLPLP